MKTLELLNGDFVIGQGGFVMIEGLKKVHQDLSVLVREALGEDRFHPMWGSILQDFVGREIGIETEADVRNEINRIIQNYMIMQTRQIQVDQTMGRRPRHKPEEIIREIRGIDIQQRNDRFNVRVKVRTSSGDELNVIRTVNL